MPWRKFRAASPSRGLRDHRRCSLIVIYPIAVRSAFGSAPVAVRRFW